MARKRNQWAERMRAEGRCITCGKPRGVFKWHCDFHGIKARLRMRRINGCKAKVAGGRGRPCKVEEA